MSMLQDLKLALRRLSSRPGYTAIAVATIAIAIGANSAMFSFVDNTVLNPLPYAEPDRIVRVFERPPTGIRSNVSTLNYVDWAEQSTVFERTAALALSGTTLLGDGEPARVLAARVSSGFFDIMGTRPALGRGFLPGDDARGNDGVVLLSHALWQRRFGADPAIVGREIVLDGRAHEVVGVLPEGSAFDRSPIELYRPLAFAAAEMTRDFHWFDVYAKLAPGTTVDAAQAEMDLIAERIAADYPDSNGGWGAEVVPLAEVAVGPNLKTAALVLFAATALVLAIGCANLASLALARGMSRRREVGVRASLGASRWRLARQFMTESLVLSCIGGLIGVGVGYTALLALDALLPPFTLPAEVELKMDAPVLAFAVCASVVTGLLFGLAPAVQASRADLLGTMKGTDRGTTEAGGGRRLRNALVVAEVALAFVLLVGAGLLIRSLDSLLDVDRGYDAANVLTAGLPVSAADFIDAAALQAYLDSVTTAVEAVPGVDGVALTSALPLQGWGYGMPYEIGDRAPIDRADRAWGYFKMVSPTYFETLRIDVLAGRPLAETDTAAAPPAIVINETFARLDFPGEGPIGKRLTIQRIVPGQPELGPDVAWEIVGVVADEKIDSLGETGTPGMYVTNMQSPVYSNYLVVRAALDPLLLQNAIRAAVADVNPNQVLSQPRTLERIESQSVNGNRLQSALLGIFAVTALSLAALGIYGVISYTVLQRTRELGIRAALGATAGSLVGLVLNGGMRLVLAGLALGAAASLASTRALGSLIYGVGVRDPATIIAVAAVLGAVAAIACLVPARRIAGIDPNAALRHE